jgi:hypothetical protein
VYYFGADQLWGAYGRYSFRRVGLGNDSSSESEENALINGLLSINTFGYLLYAIPRKRLNLVL